VSDLDSADKGALAAGAKSLIAPAYGSAGRRQAAATVGVFSLWRGARGDPRETTTTPGGGWICDERSRQDEKMTLACYEKVFGFGDDAMATRGHLLCPEARRHRPGGT
jgi:hypothetical protein